jgi:hypothetical protein
MQFSSGLKSKSVEILYNDIAKTFMSQSSSCVTNLIWACPLHV